MAVLLSAWLTTGRAGAVADPELPGSLRAVAAGSTTSIVAPPVTTTTAPPVTNTTAPPNSAAPSDTAAPPDSTAPSDPAGPSDTTAPSDAAAPLDSAGPPGTTTTILPVATVDPAIVVVPPGDLTTTTAAPATTVAASTTTTLDPVRLASLIQGLSTDVARTEAVTEFLAAQSVAAQASSGQPLSASADPVLVSVAAAELRATAAQQAARRQYLDAEHQIGKVAVALYLSDQLAPPGTTTASTPDRDVFLSRILDGQQQQAEAAAAALRGATAAFNASRARAEQRIQARTLELESVAVQAEGGSGGGAGGRATTDRRQSLLTEESPSILGPSLLTGDELDGWYQASGHQAHLTVPLDRLVAAYQDVGATDGVRADLAFAQSMVETGYFGFPSYGQVAVADNNFAGIGACDTCATGFHFPDAVTGVDAQMQLLHAYATTTEPVAGPLPGPFTVAGCCPTWMQLAGVWATAPNYGVAILTMYRTMVRWALVHRSAAARL